MSVGSGVGVILLGAGIVGFWIMASNGSVAVVKLKTYTPKTISNPIVIVTTLVITSEIKITLLYEVETGVLLDIILNIP